ncbi:MAG: lysostaphin resistance A-like protein [Acidimicrobiales bacterium]
MTDRPVLGQPTSPGQGPAPPEPRWGLGDAAIGLAAGFMISLFLGGIYVAATGEDEVSLGLTVVTLIGQWIGLLGSVVLASQRKGTGNLRHDLGLQVERRDIGIGVLAGVLCQLVLVPLLYLPFDLLGFDFDVSEEARDVLDRASGPGLALLAVCIVIGAPIAEELFFRGLLLRAADRRFGPGPAVAISAVVFGLTHFQPLQLLGLVAFGVVLALLVRRATGRLGPALVAHVAFNATTVALLVATR